MRYRRYLAWEGGCSIVLGLALALVAFPGLVVSYPHAWAGLLFVPALLAVLAVAAARRGGVARRPGTWLTQRPLARAEPGRPALDERALVRRLVVETAAWIVGVALWVVLAGSSGLLIFGTGLASAAFGAVQAGAARRRVAEEERRCARIFVVARRPGLGTPDLGLAEPG